MTPRPESGLQICDGENAQCSKENTDKGVVTGETPAATPDDTWAGCKNSRGCVYANTLGLVDEKRVGKALLKIDMAIEDPACHCHSGRQGCGDDSRLYVWTAREELHNVVYVVGGVVRGRYRFIEWLTLHEFGRTLGLPDFYTIRSGYVNWDSRLSGVNAIMDQRYNARGIKERQDIAQLDAMYVRQSPHKVDNP